MKAGIYKLVLICWMFGFTQAASAWQISGHIKKLTPCWYPRVYLALVDDITNLQGISSDHLLASASIDSSGYFNLKGADLPADERIYRLYLTRDAGSDVMISTGDSRNYILLALHNLSDVKLEVANACQPFFGFKVSGSPVNEQLQEVQQKFDACQQSLFSGKLSPTKEKYISDSFDESMLQICDTAKFQLAALLAFVLSDFETRYKTEADRYNKLLAKVLSLNEQGYYSGKIQEKWTMLQVKYHGLPAVTSFSVFWLLLLLLAVSVAINIVLFIKKQSVKHETVLGTETGNEHIEKNLDKLTIKEREILLMVDDGLSNKEIAGQLNVELSTVKTHVSRIYQKAGIKNRKEVARVARILRAGKG